MRNYRKSVSLVAVLLLLLGGVALLGNRVSAREAEVGDDRGGRSSVSVSDDSGLDNRRGAAKPEDNSGGVDRQRGLVGPEDNSSDVDRRRGATKPEDNSVVATRSSGNTGNVVGSQQVQVVSVVEDNSQRQNEALQNSGDGSVSRDVVDVGLVERVMSWVRELL